MRITLFDATDNVIVEREGSRATSFTAQCNANRRTLYNLAWEHRDRAVRAEINPGDFTYNIRNGAVIPTTQLFEEE